MDLYILLISLLAISIGIIIFYYVIKAAIRNGTIEASEKTEQQTNSELKKVIRDAVNAALESREKQSKYDLKNAVYEGVTTAIEDQRAAMEDQQRSAI